MAEEEHTRATAKIFDEFRLRVQNYSARSIFFILGVFKILSFTVVLIFDFIGQEEKLRRF